MDAARGCQEAEDGGGQQRLVIQQVSLCVGPIYRHNICNVQCINTLKLATYFSLEALPASRLDAGDVDKLEYQVQHHMTGCQQVIWTLVIGCQQAT
jgi:hypothetical protein